MATPDAVRLPGIPTCIYACLLIALPGVAGQCELVLRGKGFLRLHEIGIHFFFPFGDVLYDRPDLLLNVFGFFGFVVRNTYDLVVFNPGDGSVKTVEPDRTLFESGISLEGNQSFHPGNGRVGLDGDLIA